MNKEEFVKNYALHESFSFDGNAEDYFLARLISRYMTGAQVLDLGCGPVVPVTSVFYPNAKRVVGVDLLQENIDFMKEDAGLLSTIINRATTYRNRYLFQRTDSPSIELHCADMTKRIREFDNSFDAVLNMGAFGALDSEDDFYAAVQHAYAYLKQGGRLLMVNWIGSVVRPYHFNGSVDERKVYRPALEAAGFTIEEFHITKKYLSDWTAQAGYQGIIWAVAKKILQ